MGCLQVLSSPATTRGFLGVGAGSDSEPFCDDIPHAQGTSPPLIWILALSWDLSGVGDGASLFQSWVLWPLLHLASCLLALVPKDKVQ